MTCHTCTSKAAYKFCGKPFCKSCLLDALIAKGFKDPDFPLMLLLLTD